MSGRVRVAAQTASSLPEWLQLTLVGVLIFTAGVWLGGWVCLVVIARTTTATLARADRVKFFRRFGRNYGITATIALIIAFACGLALLVSMPWTALSTWLVALSVVLVIALALGVVQARRMTRLRHASAAAPEDTVLAAHISRGAPWAVLLRAGIGLLSLAIFVLALIRVA